jgi:cholesterol transport system auxiliary component
MKNGVRDDFPKSGAEDDPSSRAGKLHTGKSSLTPLFHAGKSLLIPLFGLLFAAFVTLTLLAACSAVTRPAPIRQTYLLDPPLPQALPQAQPGALRVGSISVAAPFRGKAFVYRMDNLRFETDFYVEFLVPPAAMLTDQTARALERAKPFSRIAGPGASVDAEWVLDGFASALYADTREAGKPAAELAITYYLTRSGGAEQTPVWSHDYRRHAPMRDSSATAFAEALNAAFGEIVAELARDLASVRLPAAK